MHAWYYRLNALFTVASTVLGALCILASITEVLHRSSPEVTAAVVSIDALGSDRGNDRAWLTLDVTADLRSIFNWNTKQAYVYATVDYSTRRNHLNRITVFDRIVLNSTSALVKERNAHVEWPFTLMDQGRGLRGTPFNVTVAWQTVPITGVLLSGHRTFTGFSFPQQYVRAGNSP